MHDPATRSLRTTLLFWLIASLLCSAIVGSAAAILINRHTAGSFYDEELLDTALSIDRYLHSALKTPDREAEVTEINALLFDPVDELRFAVFAPTGTVISGAADVPKPPGANATHGAVFYDGVFDGQPMRWVSVRGAHSDAPSAPVIVVGETLNKRIAATRKAILYGAAPQLLLAFTLALVMRYGIGRGLRPLQQVQQRISARSASDLRPLDVADAPQEVRVLVSEINALLGRLAVAFAEQQTFIGNAAHQLDSRGDPRQSAAGGRAERQHQPDHHRRT